MMLMKRLQSYLLTCACSLLSFLALSQQSTVTGKVVDDSGNPLTGVSVTVKGKNTATITTEKGEFAIAANAGETLQFSHVGFNNIEHKIGSTNAISIRL